jgi:hypothetical protein
MKTGLNNVLLPTLFIAVNNIEQYCYTRFRLNNIVQYCWQVWTTWAAKHCSVLLRNGLGVFCRVLPTNNCDITFSTVLGGNRSKRRKHGLTLVRSENEQTQRWKALALTTAHHRLIIYRCETLTYFAVTRVVCLRHFLAPHRVFWQVSLLTFQVKVQEKRRSKG